MGCALYTNAPFLEISVADLLQVSAQMSHFQKGPSQIYLKFHLSLPIPFIPFYFSFSS